MFSKYIDPKSEPSDRKWTPVSVDLRQFAHREVEIELVTHPKASSAYDWAGWAEPRIVVR